MPYRLAIAILASVSAVPAARAQDASAWDVEPHAAARLIAGSSLKIADAAARNVAASNGATSNMAAAPMAASKADDASSLRAGVEIRLDPGWKTYWRYPGDSGVPPTLNFDGSENVKSVTILWPAPRRFADGAGGNSIGYTDDVVLPLQVVAEDASKPASLHVKLGYAVCGNLCLPAEASLDLALSGIPGSEETALRIAEARVPRRVALGAAGELAVRSVHRETENGRERVVVEVAAPSETPVDLFVEGPTSNWSLPLPEPSGSRGTIRRFSFDLEGVPSDTQAAGATLTLTAVSPDDAIEVATHLD